MSGDNLGLRDEIQLLGLLRHHNLDCAHRLEQRKITDFLIKANPSTKVECNRLFRQNRMLPREKQTQQVDLFAWKRNHWAALAIEEKHSFGVRKTLDITKDFVTLKANFNNESKNLKKSGKQLYLQCKGEGLLTQAYCYAVGINAKAVPIGVVDYDLMINSRISTPWAYHRGVFFINKDYFPWFLNEYIMDNEWIRDTVEENPKISFGRI